MRKHLQMAALIMLIALTLTPVSVFAHPDPGVTYAHASDCTCSECVAKRETSMDTGMALAEKLTNLLKGTEQMRTAYYFVIDMFGSSKSVPYIEDPGHIPFN